MCCGGLVSDSGREERKAAWGSWWQRKARQRATRLRQLRRGERCGSKDGRGRNKVRGGWQRWQHLAEDGSSGNVVLCINAAIEEGSSVGCDRGDGRWQQKRMKDGDDDDNDGVDGKR
ncbi:hypothetical protein BHE74_00022925 [Ensete ventricosum]|nr:hypothetical protein BHE74_00022925 [Ensete ventricosum]